MKYAIFLSAALTIPAMAQAQPITSLTIHSDENREYCNDGFSWDAAEKMCMPDNGR
nr:hypothetical protein [uncultured Shimia sp.]